MRHRYFLALDQGTSSSRAILFDGTGRAQRTASVPLSVTFPRDGWVEQDPRQIWSTQRQALLNVLDGVPPGSVVAAGITNQRETVLGWERSSGNPVTPAIVWQCRRSAAICDQLKTDGLEPEFRRKTGLVIDAYFSATKIRWMLENIPPLRPRVESGDVVFGTVDSWLVWKLTEASEKSLFLTEPTNASRTMLYHLERGDWDDSLLKQFGLTRDNVAVVMPSQSDFGTINFSGQPSGSSVPILAVLGDQQASLFGHGCFEKGGIKCTFGTGAFLLLHCGNTVPHSASGLIATAAAGEKQYALEGSIFVAGAAIQWLRDKLKIIASAAESETLARTVPDSGGVLLIPAFVGLGAPHWKHDARGAIFGLTRDSSAAHIARAALDGVAHQVADLFDDPAFKDVALLRIDGGMSENRLFCQILANLLGIRIERASSAEASAFGVAALASLGVDRSRSLSQLREELSEGFQAGESFSSQISSSLHGALRTAWKQALLRL